MKKVYKIHKAMQLIEVQKKAKPFFSDPISSLTSFIKENYVSAKGLG